MSNSSTLVDTIPVQTGGFQTVKEYEIVIDTTATDLDILTPQSTNRLWVVGISLADGAALNLTFKSINTTTSTTTKSRTWELAANQGLTGFIDNGFYFCTGMGEKLTIQSSVAIGASVGKNLVLYVGENPSFRRV